MISLLYLASSATRELDELMASLSDFKVSAAGNNEPSKSDMGRIAEDGTSKPSPTPNSMQSKTDDYAKVDKQPSIKSKCKLIIVKGCVFNYHGSLPHVVQMF